MKSNEYHAIEYDVELLLATFISRYLAEIGHDVTVRQGQTPLDFATPCIICSCTDAVEPEGRWDSGNWDCTCEMIVYSSAYDQDSSASENLIGEEHKERVALVRQPFMMDDIEEQLNECARAETDLDISIEGVTERSVSNGTDGTCLVNSFKFTLSTGPEKDVYE